MRTLASIGGPRHVFGMDLQCRNRRAQFVRGRIGESALAFESERDAPQEIVQRTHDAPHFRRHCLSPIDPSDSGSRL